MEKILCTDLEHVKRNKDKKRYSLDDVEKELGINDDVARK